MLLSFNKFHGAGNDFILLDIREFDPFLIPETIRFLCDRRFGIGADGLITLGLDARYPFFMRYFNADGKESTMCGNGGRCITLFARQLGLCENEINFNAIDGEHKGILLEYNNSTALIRLKMRDVNEINYSANYTVLNTGSPHYVRFCDQVDALDVKAEGKKIRYSQDFLPDGININFVERQDNALFVRTYERGVEDETLACGTGVTAAALVSCSVFPDIQSPVNILTLGGRLKVHFQKEGSGFKDIWLEGPAVKVYSGSIEI